MESSRKWILKSGEVKCKSYKEEQSNYNKKHYDTYKDYYSQDIKCVCGSTYKPTNKHNHLNTKYHKLYIKMLENKN